MAAGSERFLKIAQKYSHLNGLEHLLIHKPNLWAEIERVIAAVDASKCKTKKSKEKRKKGQMLYSPPAMNKCFAQELGALQWQQSKVSYWVTADDKLIRKTIPMEPAQQKKEIEAAGEKAIATYNQTDFVKDRIAIEVQFGKYAFVAFDMFVKHMAFYVGDKIDVGVEILPMKALQAQMSSGVPYYERGLYDMLRQGRGIPAVPFRRRRCRALTTLAVRDEISSTTSRTRPCYSRASSPCFNPFKSVLIRGYSSSSPATPRVSPQTRC